MNTLDNPIRFLKGVGPKRAESLSKLGIHNVEDLLYYFPRRYQDRTKITPIAELIPGQTYTIKAEVLAKGGRQSFYRNSFSIIEIAAGDDTGRIFCVWFNQPYLKNYFNVGQALILYGKVDLFGRRLQMNAPDFEIVTEEANTDKNSAGIIPVYTLPQGLGQRYVRKIIKQALESNISKIQDFLPFDIRQRAGLLNLAKSLLNIHFPEDITLQKQAYVRLAFEEFFLFQLPLAVRKLKRHEKKGIAHKMDGELLPDFLARLPFSLTTAQEKTIQEIKMDMARPAPMQRLIQGDVGSGKTVVAVSACIIAIQGGYQAVFMAPTEILAKQHFEKIKSQVTGQKSQVKEIRIGLLVGSLGKREKGKVYEQMRKGEIDLIIGTHALLEEKIEFKNLGIAVIDEQHKFGVGQRALLSHKALNPDVLIMTATPIPRTLAITLYGDLDISVINELPPGRQPILTMHLKQDQANKAYEIAKAQLEKGRQAYIVYPVIDESFALDIAGAKNMHKELKEKEFRQFRVGLIHGQLKPKEQNEIMQKFKDKQIDLLVATTVLEVGIDIDTATCIIIMHAERFGLAQLHQLRGRVGRGSDESFCLLISDALTEEAAARLEAMVKYSDGFKIAEEDLRIRGPGEFFGSRQHGLTELKIANPLTQMQLLKKAREEALRLINNDPYLEARQNLLLKEKLKQRFPEYEKLMIVG